MDVIAHRGANREAPENTFASFERALELGVDGLEADVQITKDDKLIIRHDDLIQYRGDWSYIHELSLDELQAIDLGRGEHMPTAEAFLERFYGRCPLVLDVKAFGCASALQRILGGRRKNLRVTSFLHQEIQDLGKWCPQVQRAITVAAVPVRFDDLLSMANTRAVSVFRGYLNESLVRDLVAQDIAVRAYPVNLLREAKQFAAWGLEAVYTDDPAALQPIRTKGRG